MRALGGLYKMFRSLSSNFKTISLLVLALIMACSPVSLLAQATAAQSSSTIDWIEAVAGLLALITAVILFRNEQMKRRLRDAESLIDSFRSFASHTLVMNYSDTDLIFLGPRFHGKTSIVTAMTKQWQQVLDTRPTLTDFSLTIWETSAFVDQKCTHEVLGIPIIKRNQARIMVYDYAGEDQSIGPAMDRLSKSARSIVVFVMSAEDEFKSSTSSYFNTNTLRRMRKAVTELRSSDCSAFILFSKHDLMQAPPADPTDVPTTLLDRHSLAIENIAANFGDVDRFIVSAETGFGVSTALRSMLAHVVDNTGVPK